MLALKVGKISQAKFFFNTAPRFDIYQIIGRPRLGFFHKNNEKRWAIVQLKYVYETIENLTECKKIVRKKENVCKIREI